MWRSLGRAAKAKAHVREAPLDLFTAELGADPDAWTILSRVAAGHTGTWTT